MKRSYENILMFLVLLTSIIFITTHSSAQTAPYLVFGGNYQYDADTKALTFTDNYADWLEYTNGNIDCPFPEAGCPGTDPILGAALSFGTLMNSSSNNLIFGPDPGGAAGPVDFSIDGFFTAKLDNFIIEDGTLMWGSLSNITPANDAPYSRYIDELLTNGGGSGMITLSYTRNEPGGVEDFKVTSYGAAGGMVAAPEPVSSVLFITGVITLTFRQYRKKRN